MSDRAIVSLLRVLALSGAVVSIFAAGLTLVDTDPAILLSEGGAFLVFAIFFAVVVWVVAPRQPRNAVVWLMATTAAASGAYLAAWLIATAIVGDPGLLEQSFHVPADIPPRAAWIIALVVPVATGLMVAQLTFGILLFPDGRLPSRRWRFAAALILLGITLEIAGLSWAFRPSNTASTANRNPLVDAGDLLVLVGALLSLVGLWRRFASSGGQARQQIKWILWGASILVLSLSALLIWDGTAVGEVLLALFALAGGVFVVAYGIAVGKYRLYDIDLVISRTFVYGALAVFITGVYVAAVVGAGGVLGIDAGSSPWLWLGATVLIAIVFEPLRERLQRLANRLVYGRRATPYEVLSEFAHRITGSDEALLNQVARSLAKGTTAASAKVWVRSGDTFHRVAEWPPGDGAAVASQAALALDCDLVRLVVYEDEVLGALTLTAARSQALLPTDERLLEQLASGLGLVLRNTSLGEDLRARVEELRRSRERLVTVQDETRRLLERQLHDGVQQRLVALKVKLALVRRRAETAGSSEVANLLGNATGETDMAIESLRDFARGVYPPLLEAEGPAAALTSQTLKLPIKVIVDTSGVARYPRPVEAAVYFCILEALQNVAKHAGAAEAHVVLLGEDGALRFEVSDDGRGFDPSLVHLGSGLTNLADRLDALDGRLEVTSSPGRGTTIRGRLPIPHLEAVP